MLFQPDGPSGADPVTGAASREEPSTTVVPQLAAARTTVTRSWRSGRVISAIGGAALLLLTGSVTAWQLSASPQATGLAAHGKVTPPPASHAAANAPATSASRSSAAAAVPPPGSASPSAFPASSPAHSPASPRTRVPREFPLRVAVGHPHGQPAVSAPASSAPPVVAIPDVVGLRFAKAAQVLESLGFTVTGKHSRAGLIVIRTNPSGEAPEGSRIIVVY